MIGPNDTHYKKTRMTRFGFENLVSGWLTRVSAAFNTEINWQQGGFANSRWEERYHGVLDS